MSQDFKTDSRQVIGNLDQVVTRSHVALLAFGSITSEESLQYFKDISKEDDIVHNLDSFFEELRAIHDLLNEENEELREYKLKLQREWVQNVQ